MKRISTLNWLFIILAVSLVCEAFAFVTAGFSEKPIFRVAFLLLLFTLTIKGFRWARYLLAILYGLGGVFALVSAMSMAMPLSTKIGLGIFGVFGLASSAFLFCAKVLCELSKSLERGG